MMQGQRTEGLAEQANSGSWISTTTYSNRLGHISPLFSLSLQNPEYWCPLVVVLVVARFAVLRPALCKLVQLCYTGSASCYTSQVQLITVL